MLKLINYPRLSVSYGRPASTVTWHRRCQSVSQTRGIRTPNSPKMSDQPLLHLVEIADLQSTDFFLSLRFSFLISLMSGLDNTLTDELDAHHRKRDFFYPADCASDILFFIYLHRRRYTWTGSSTYLLWKSAAAWRPARCPHKSAKGVRPRPRLRAGSRTAAIGAEAAVGAEAD